MRTLAATLLLLVLPATVHGQTALSFRFGGAHGPGRPTLVGLAVKTPLLPHVRAFAALTEYHSFASCNQTWPDSFRCGYGGWLAQAGAALTAVRTEDAYVEATGGGGWFTHNLHDSARRHAAWSAGAEVGMRLVGHLWLEAGFHWLWIRDTTYRGFFGEYPSMRAVTAGVGWAL